MKKSNIFRIVAAQGRSPLSLGVILLALMGVGLGSCEQTPVETGDSSQNDRVQVVATSTIIQDLTEQIAEGEVSLTGVLEPGADPHIYEPVPADTVAFEQADLILYNGYNLEPGLVRLMNATGVDAEKVAVGEVVAPLQMDYDNQTVPDPHVWGDVSNVIPMVEAIRDALIERSPQDQATFTANADQLIAELEQLHEWIGAQVATIPANQRQLITTHDAFQYYAQAYGLTVPGTLIGMSTEEQPSAQTIQTLVEAVRQTGIPTIFAETTINPRLIGTVAEEADVQLAEQELFSDSIGAPGSAGDSYINMMVVNTQTIVENLGGQPTEFEPTE